MSASDQQRQRKSIIDALLSHPDTLSPPPAYSASTMNQHQFIPNVQPGHPGNQGPGNLGSFGMQANQAAVQAAQAAQAAQVSAAAMNDFMEENARLSDLRIKIDVPLNITGDNNIVATDLAASAGKIAIAVVTSLRQLSGDNVGLAMVDGEGEPRPIDIVISASMKIEGSQNVVGDQSIISDEDSERVDMRNLEETAQHFRAQNLKREREQQADQDHPATPQMEPKRFRPN